MYCRLTFLFFVFFTLSISCFGQVEEARFGEARSGLWLGSYTKLRLGEKIYYYAETHYRRQNSAGNRLDFAGSMGKIYNRHGINYLVNKYFEVTAGPVLVLNYAQDPTDPKFERMVPEYRIWHQYLLIQPQMGRVKIYHQFRFEHRFRRSLEIAKPEYMYTTRYRYKIYAYIPLNKPYLAEKTFYLSPSVEVFLHSGETVAANPLEDLRIYPVLGYIINENYMVSAGYTWTLGQARTGYEYNQTHLIRLNLYVNFDLRGAKRAVPKIHMRD